MEKTLQVLNVLEREGVLRRYAIGDAMGATFYAEPVLTFDLDIFVEALRARGYTEEGECVNIEGVPVQFLPAHNDLLVEALAEAREALYEQTPTRVLRAEHLAAIALQMEAMDNLRPEIARLIAAKEQRRRKLAALSFAEKVRVVVQLQQMVAPVLRARGRPVRVWPLANPKPVGQK